MDKIIEKKNASITANYFVKDMNYYINIDGEKIKTLLKNLIENAIIYNDKEKPEVSLTVEENRNIIKFKVKDNGIGMPEKELNNIFDSFYRVDKARTSNMAGTGLGLSIVKEIVDIHKGDIKVNSQEGQGTEFVIRIPK
jgi:two-component system phosphate regulon sensor histidine kinase PhoR